MKWLSSSFLLARIRGMEIRFHFSTLFSIPIAYYLFRPTDLRQAVMAFSWLLGFLLCILLHELGHAFAAQLFGVKVKSVVIWLLGGFTNLSRKADKPLHEVVISAAGPLVNMLLAFLCVLLYIIFHLFVLPASATSEIFLWIQTFSRLFFSLALVNLILIVFNLLPIYPLDGGGILRSFMENFFGRANADLIALIVGAPVLLGLLALGFYTRDYLMIASCFLIALALSTLNRSALRSVNLAVNYLFKRGGYYYLLGDYDRAAQYYAREIENEPQQSNHYLARAACLLNILQTERAKADVERALRLAPQNPLALELRGEICALEKDYDSALDFFARAQEVNPNWAVPYFDRGSVLLERKEYQLALAEFDKSVSLLPQFSLFYIIRSIAHFRLADFESAHKDQDSALRISEQDSLAMTDLNMIVYEDCLDWAEDYYARVLSSQPRLGFAYQGRADAYRVNGKHDQAIEDYARAINLAPKESRLYIGRGKSYRALNEIEKAKSDFQKAIALADKSHLKRQAENLYHDICAI
ncbi:MAG: M50 family metallopeptidase [Anaerolineales bacterium]|nr:M50 family metallopeptidase [Anaerolineales bacterium]